MRLFSTIAVFALLLGAPALAETSVGVTAAVNPDATGTVGSTVRTISLGDSVVFNQRIETGGTGLVQVLLADGTTFMVGPNSNLVIDSFVYDPNAGTAQVTASFTKGVLRFIGGQTSKTEGGVTINTPVGTMGIRGAMVDIVLDPPEGTPPHIDMLFGNEVTLEQGQQLLGRLYAAGYSLALGDNGAFDVLKTPPGWGSQIQAALAGRAGATGGAPKGPSDGDVKNSEVANNNSGKGADNGSQPLSKEELAALLAAAAQYDELRNFILNNQAPNGYVGGIVTTGESGPYGPGITDFDYQYGEGGLESYDPTYAKLVFDADGNPFSIEAAFLASISCDECDTDTDVDVVYTGNGTNGAGQLLITYPGEEPIPVLTNGDYLYAFDDSRENNPMNGAVQIDSNPDDDIDEQILADQLNCQRCSEFVRWGFWGFSADNEDVTIGQIDGSASYMGTWVSGNLTTRAQMDNLSEMEEGDLEASYRGDAVGVVHYNDGSYVATGDLDMTWNFGEREGAVAITGFDTGHRNDGEGIDILYNVDGPISGENGFFGSGSGSEPYSSGLIQGGFVNLGSTVAGGVMGNWNYGEASGYSASGVFMGDTLTPPPATSE